MDAILPSTAEAAPPAVAPSDDLPLASATSTTRSADLADRRLLAAVARAGGTNGEAATTLATGAGDAAARGPAASATHADHLPQPAQHRIGDAHGRADADRVPGEEPAPPTGSTAVGRSAAPHRTDLHPGGDRSERTSDSGPDGTTPRTVDGADRPSRERAGRDGADGPATIAAGPTPRSISAADPSRSNATESAGTAPPPAADASPEQRHQARAWDDARPSYDDIGGWRYHAGDWHWEDAAGRQVAPPTWSRPNFQPDREDCRVPLDSALMMGLFQQSQATGRSVAPGVVAQVAAALSTGELTPSAGGGAVSGLLQRMTVDQQLDVAAGVAALREHGAPEVVAPYAPRIARMATAFHDGTFNHMDDPEEYGGTNIAAMYKLMLTESQIDRQVPTPHYYGGVGNSREWGPVMHLVGGITGAGLASIEERSRKEFAADLAAGIVDNAIFGFSRGAAGALDTLNAYPRIAGDRPFETRFVGMFDVVSAMDGKVGGTGGLELRIPQGDHRPDSVYHAVSRDEDRVRFPVRDIGPGDDRVFTDEFTGAHSDVGGGYANKGLSNIALHRMIENAQRAGVPMPSVEEVIALHPGYADVVMPFLHQDHNEERHLENGMVFALANDARKMPTAARPSEFPAARLEREVVTQHLAYKDADFDRRATANDRVLTFAHMIEVDPTGRFRYRNADPAPRPASPWRGPPSHENGTLAELPRSGE